MEVPELGQEIYGSSSEYVGGVGAEVSFGSHDKPPFLCAPLALAASRFSVRPANDFVAVQSFAYGQEFPLLRGVAQAAYQRIGAFDEEGMHGVGCCAMREMEAWRRSPILAIEHIAETFK